MNRRLRIVLAPSAYYPHVGGIEELTRQLALCFAARGHEVFVLTNRWPEGARRAEMLDGVRVKRLRFPLPAARPLQALTFLATGPLAAVAVVRKLRSLRPDVLHVIGAGPQSAYFSVLARPLGVATVFTAQGELTFDAEDIFYRSTTLRVALRRILKVADAVTACSAFILRDLEKLGPISAPATVIPNGVDPAEFEGEDRERRFGRYILAVGRLVPQKGFDVLLDALSRCASTETNLVIAGDGFERRRLEEQATQLGLASRVTLLGAVDRIGLGRLYRGAAGFAFPSRGEPFGIALLEAMAAGVPAVAAAAGGVPEFARDRENALLVAPESAAELAQAIDLLLTDTELRVRLVDGGRRTAHLHAWDHLSVQYERIYTKVAHTAG